MLLECVDAQTKWPSAELIGSYSEVIQLRSPRLVGAFGFIDGLNLPVQSPSDDGMHSTNYNDWLHCNKVANLLTFAPDGCLFHTLTNCLGSWLGSVVARPLHELPLRNDFPRNKCLLADPWFPLDSDTRNKYILVPLKNNRARVGTPEQWEKALSLTRDIINARQSTAWVKQSISRFFRTA